MYAIKKEIRDIFLSSSDSKEKEKDVSISAVHDVTIISRVVVNMPSGENCISEADAAHIKELVYEVARMERMHGHRKATPAMVWVKLKDHLKVTSYKLLAKERRGEAVGFLTDWMFRINEDRFRDPVTLEERARMYRECHGIAKRYGLYAEMRALMERKWDAESMRDLDDAALRDLRAFMRALEAQHKTATR